MRYISAALALVALTLAAPVMADDDDDKQHKAGYDNGFYIRSADDDYKIKLNGRLQSRFTYEYYPEDTDSYYFSIPRARFVTSGHVFTDDLTWKFEADFGEGDPSLKDYWFNYRALKYFQLRFGQWKKPFSRQQITSSGKLQFQERALTDKAFDAGRDIGVAVHSGYEKSPPFEYAVGFYNGTGDNEVPDAFRPLIVTRVGFNVGDAKGYDESSLGNQVGFGMAWSSMTDIDADNSNDGFQSHNVDMLMRLWGFSCTAGGYISHVQNGEDLDALDFDAIGYHAQAGYNILQRVEPVVRYSKIHRRGDNQASVAGGLNVFFIDHRVKWQTDVTHFLTENAQNHTVVMSQMQFAL